MRRFSKLVVVVTAVLVGQGAMGCNFPLAADLASARNEARAKKRPIIMLFTGLDWSPRSVALDKKVLEHISIEELVLSSFVALMVDFPQRVKLPPATQAANLKLAEKFGVTHFPVIVVVDHEERELGRIDYRDEGVEQIEKFLRRHLAGNAPAARTEIQDRKTP